MPEKDNDRALLLGKLICELRPDVVVMGGDTGDFPSLCSYDKGKKQFQGRTYQADVAAHNDFQDKMWHEAKKRKKKLPRRYTLIGNHEQRIERAIDVQPELEGVISYRDLDLDKYYDVVIPYTGNTPGGVSIDGVYYAHYLVSGSSGRPIAGENHASSLLSKRYSSCSVGHSHGADYSIKTQNDGNKLMGLVGGCFFDYDLDYAGEANKLWWRGVTVKRGVERGMYDVEFISLANLKKRYGNVRR
jgi:hypothetical protein